MSETKAIAATYFAFMAALAGVALAIPAITHANPSSFANGVTTGSTASSTPAYMTPGTATSTTPVFDAYAQTASGGVTSKADNAGLLLQFTGSSTASKLTGNVEYSQDGIDWYRNYVFDPTQSQATSTANNLNSPFTLLWLFASSTVGGAAQTNTNRSTAALLIPTPFRYTRVVFSITGGNGAVWAQLVPIKEQR